LEIDLSGHVAIVTGGNHGIGAAVSRRLTAAGAAVLVNFLRVATDESLPTGYIEGRAASADLLVDSIVDSGGCAHGIEADLTHDGTPRVLFDEAERRFGPVDILINNATGWAPDTFGGEQEDRVGRAIVPVSPETIDAQLGVDARGSALLIAELAARHRRHGLSWGRIVGLTSGGRLGFPEEVSYGAAKAALENYTMSAAFELADRGITANIVYPPVTDTGWVTDEVRRHVATSAELIHIVGPDDVAEVICYLVSDHARFITANVIHMR